MKNFKFTISGNKYEVHIKNLEDNIAEIEVNGTTYKVEVEHEVTKPKTPVLVRKPVEKPAGSEKIQKTQTTGGAAIKAPLPGTILNIKTQVGSTVSKGDTLMIMEAMKMENSIQAERDGKIKSIKVKEGDNVLEGEVLIELE